MSALKRTVAVTGAFSYSGRHIAEAFLARGWRVVTLTRQPERPHPLQDRVEAFPLDFQDPAQLEASLRGVDTLVNTYWVRFDYGDSSFAGAVDNSAGLFEAAQAAGVRRLVHLSVSKADLKSDLPYYHGKAQVEEVIKASGLSYAILRPTLIFGPEEVLLNNIAWLLRRFPVFPVPGDGRYRLQPIWVKDLAEACADQAEASDNMLLTAGGPESYSFEELLKLLARALDRRVLFPHLPPRLALGLAKAVSAFLGDVMLTGDELAGLMQERLFVGSAALGQRSFADWLGENACQLGRDYAHELRRHHQKA